MHTKVHRVKVFKACKSGRNGFECEKLQKNIVDCMETRLYAY